MAATESVNQLLEISNTITGTPIDEVIKNPNWGEINFEESRENLLSIFSIFNHLKNLPLEKLPEQAINPIINAGNSVIQTISAIRNFKITQTNHIQVKASLVRDLTQKANEIFNASYMYIPYLAYQKGDIQKNIEALNDSITTAKSLVNAAEIEIAGKTNSLDKIITSAREASAGAGAAVFTQDFNSEATNLIADAKKWLRVTGIFAAGTVALALLMYFLPAPSDELVQKFVSKIAILGISITITMWCSGNYKALMHQATVNKHRALSLQTFQAFSHAASDSQTKDAVLMEATRAIFGQSSSGFINQKSGGSENQTQIIEIARAAPIIKTVADVAH